MSCIENLLVLSEEKKQDDLAHSLPLEGRWTPPCSVVEARVTYNTLDLDGMSIMPFGTIFPSSKMITIGKVW